MNGTRTDDDDLVRVKLLYWVAAFVDLVWGFFGVWGLSMTVG